LLLESISIVNFRNHERTEFQPGPSVTVIHGNNGSGKTGILEAIHYCALTRGFSRSGDKDSLSFGKDLFTIRGNFLHDNGVKTTGFNDAAALMDGEDLLIAQYVSITGSIWRIYSSTEGFCNNEMLFCYNVKKVENIVMHLRSGQISLRGMQHR